MGPMTDHLDPHETVPPSRKWAPVNEIVLVPHLKVFSGGTSNVRLVGRSNIAALATIVL